MTLFLPKNNLVVVMFDIYQNFKGKKVAKVFYLEGFGGPTNLIIYFLIIKSNQKYKK